MTPARRGTIRCAVAAVLFGTTTPLAAELAGEMPAPVLAGLLYLGAGAAVLPAAQRRRGDRAALGRARRPLAVAVLTGGLLGPLLLMAGLARTPAATSSLLLNGELVATIVLAAVFFGEHLGRRVVFGTTMVVAAGVFLAWSGGPELRTGAVLIVAACVCWGVDNCVTAGLDTVAPATITLAKGVIAGSTNLAIGLLVGDGIGEVGAVLAALVLGAVGYGASITFWVTGARDLGAARAQLVFATAPFVGVLVAWVALGGAIRAAEVVALGLAAIGVAAVVGSAHEHGHHHGEMDHDHEHDHDAHHRHDHPDGDGDAYGERHSHAHHHHVLVHAHPHVPDLHHRHEHDPSLDG